MYIQINTRNRLFFLLRSLLRIAEWSVGPPEKACLKRTRMRGLDISMTSEDATPRSCGCVYSRLRLQLSLAELGRSTMLCSGRACIGIVISGLCTTHMLSWN